MRNQDLTVKLITRIKSLIATAVLVPGSKLPPERELASHFGVSRPSLRQALKVLEIMGVISQRVGDGTYLNQNVSEILNEPMEFLILMGGISIHELVELRSILEPELAALAAERATAEDLRGLARAIKDYEKNPRDLRASIEADLSFHRAIFHAAGNRVCSRILAFIHRSVWQSLTFTAQLVESQKPLAGHKAIYSAIDRRNAAEARQQMIEHMRRAKELLVKASGRPVDLNLAKTLRPAISARDGNKKWRSTNRKTKRRSLSSFGSVIRKGRTQPQIRPSNGTSRKKVRAPLTTSTASAQ